MKSLLASALVLAAVLSAVHAQTACDGTNAPCECTGAVAGTYCDYRNGHAVCLQDAASGAMKCSPLSSLTTCDILSKNATTCNFHPSCGMTSTSPAVCVGVCSASPYRSTCICKGEAANGIPCANDQGQSTCSGTRCLLPCDGNNAQACACNKSAIDTPCAQTTANGATVVAARCAKNPITNVNFCRPVCAAQAQTQCAAIAVCALDGTTCVDACTATYSGKCGCKGDLTQGFQCDTGKVCNQGQCVPVCDGKTANCTCVSAAVNTACYWVEGAVAATCRSSDPTTNAKQECLANPCDSFTNGTVCNIVPKCAWNNVTKQCLNVCNGTYTAACGCKTTSTVSTRDMQCSTNSRCDGGARCLPVCDNKIADACTCIGSTANFTCSNDGVTFGICQASSTTSAGTAPRLECRPAPPTPAPCSSNLNASACVTQSGCGWNLAASVCTTACEGTYIGTCGCRPNIQGRACGPKNEVCSDGLRCLPVCLGQSGNCTCLNAKENTPCTTDGLVLGVCQNVSTSTSLQCRPAPPAPISCDSLTNITSCLNRTHCGWNNNTMQCQTACNDTFTQACGCRYELTDGRQCGAKGEVCESVRCLPVCDGLNFKTGACVCLKAALDTQCSPDGVFVGTCQLDGTRRSCRPVVTPPAPVPCSSLLNATFCLNQTRCGWNNETMTCGNACPEVFADACTCRFESEARQCSLRGDVCDGESIRCLPRCDGTATTSGGVNICTCAGSKVNTTCSPDGKLVGQCQPVLINNRQALRCRPIPPPTPTPVECRTFVNATLCLTQHGRCGWLEATSSCAPRCNETLNEACGCAYEATYGQKCSSRGEVCEGVRCLPMCDSSNFKTGPCTCANVPLGASCSTDGKMVGTCQETSASKVRECRLYVPPAPSCNTITEAQKCIMQDRCGWNNVTKACATACVNDTITEACGCRGPVTLGKTCALKGEMCEGFSCLPVCDGLTSPPVPCSCLKASPNVACAGEFGVGTCQAGTTGRAECRAVVPPPPSCNTFTEAAKCNAEARCGFNNNTKICLPVCNATYNGACGCKGELTLARQCSDDKRECQFGACLPVCGSSATTVGDCSCQSAAVGSTCGWVNGVAAAACQVSTSNANRKECVPIPRPVVCDSFTTVASCLEAKCGYNNVTKKCLNACNSAAYAGACGCRDGTRGLQCSDDKNVCEELACVPVCDGKNMLNGQCSCAKAPVDTACVAVNGVNVATCQDETTATAVRRVCKPIGVITCDMVKAHAECNRMAGCAWDNSTTPGVCLKACTPTSVDRCGCKEGATNGVRCGDGQVCDGNRCAPVCDGVNRERCSCFGSKLNTQCYWGADGSKGTCQDGSAVINTAAGTTTTTTTASSTNLLQCLRAVQAPGDCDAREWCNIQGSQNLNVTASTSFKLAASVTFDCLVAGAAGPKVVWSSEPAVTLPSWEGHAIGIVAGTLKPGVDYVFTVTATPAAPFKPKIARVRVRVTSMPLQLAVKGGDLRETWPMSQLQLLVEARNPDAPGVQVPVTWRCASVDPTTKTEGPCPAVVKELLAAARPDASGLVTLSAPSQGFQEGYVRFYASAQVGDQTKEVSQLIRFLAPPPPPSDPTKAVVVPVPTIQAYNGMPNPEQDHILFCGLSFVASNGSQVSGGVEVKSIVWTVENPKGDTSIFVRGTNERSVTIGKAALVKYAGTGIEVSVVVTTASGQTVSARRTIQPPKPLAGACVVEVINATARAVVGSNIRLNVSGFEGSPQFKIVWLRPADNSEERVPIPFNADGRVFQAIVPQHPAFLTTQSTVLTYKFAAIARDDSTGATGFATCQLDVFARRDGSTTAPTTDQRAEALQKLRLEVDSDVKNANTDDCLANAAALAAALQKKDELLQQQVLLSKSEAEQATTTVLSAIQQAITTNSASGNTAANPITEISKQQKEAAINVVASLTAGKNINSTDRATRDQVFSVLQKCVESNATRDASAFTAGTERIASDAAAQAAKVVADLMADLALRNAAQLQTEVQRNQQQFAEFSETVRKQPNITRDAVDSKTAPSAADRAAVERNIVDAKDALAKAQEVLQKTATTLAQQTRPGETVVVDGGSARVTAQVVLLDAVAQTSSTLQASSTARVDLPSAVFEQARINIQKQNGVQNASNLNDDKAASFATQATVTRYAENCLGLKGAVPSIKNVTNRTESGVPREALKVSSSEVVDVKMMFNGVEQPVKNLSTPATVTLRTPVLPDHTNQGGRVETIEYAKDGRVLNKFNLTLDEHKTRAAELSTSAVITRVPGSTADATEKTDVARRTHTTTQTKVACSWFDTAKGEWSQDGVKVSSVKPVQNSDGTTSGDISCECAHFTTFMATASEQQDVSAVDIPAANPPSTGPNPPTTGPNPPTTGPNPPTTGPNPPTTSPTSATGGAAPPTKKSPKNAGVIAGAILGTLVGLALIAFVALRIQSKNAHVSESISAYEDTEMRGNPQHSGHTPIHGHAQGTPTASQQYSQLHEDDLVL